MPAIESIATHHRRGLVNGCSWTNGRQSTLSHLRSPSKHYTPVSLQQADPVFRLLHTCSPFLELSRDAVFANPIDQSLLTCRQLSQIAQQGLVEATNCRLLPMIIGDLCGCQSESFSTEPAPDNTEPSITSTSPTTTNGTTVAATAAPAGAPSGVISPNSEAPPIQLQLAAPSALRVDSLQFISVVTGSFSLLGSLGILVALVRQHRQVRGRRASGRAAAGQSGVYNRLLAAMSAYDLVLTIGGVYLGLILGTGMGHGIDSGASRLACTLQGFLIQVGAGSRAYGAWLNVYYNLTIRYNVRENVLVKYFEPAVHIGVLVFYVGSATIASGIGLMNPMSVSVCWIAPYPIFCSQIDYVPCQRGSHYEEAALFMVLIPCFLAMTVILISLSMVACTVRKQGQVVRRQQFQVLANYPGDTSGESQQKTTSSISLERKPRQSKLERLANEVILQCVFSGCSVVSTTVWSVVGYWALLTGQSERMLTDLYWVSLLHIQRNVLLLADHDASNSRANGVAYGIPGNPTNGSLAYPVPAPNVC
jgi:hypothetical protein